jgi:hypothetical protein
MSSPSTKGGRALMGPAALTSVRRRHRARRAKCSYRSFQR